mgnify:FL=1
MAGLKFRSFELENVVYYKKQAFKLSRVGISVIYGINLNTSSGKSAGVRNTNAVGKSLFFSLIPELIYGAPSLGVRQDKVRAGKLTLRVTSGAHKYAYDLQG